MVAFPYRKRLVAGDIVLDQSEPLACYAAHGLVGMPLGLYLAFQRNRSVSGIFYGHLASIAVNAVIARWAISKVDGEASCEEARGRSAPAAVALPAELESALS